MNLHSSPFPVLPDDSTVYLGQPRYILMQNFARMWAMQAIIPVSKSEEEEVNA